MITAEEFAALLTRGEGPQLDFKRDPYKLTEEEGRAALIKDVLAMANTPRDDNSYIVLGVRAHADGSKDLVGLSEAVDDNTYQNAVKSKVHPCPRFLYVPLAYEGRAFGGECLPGIGGHDGVGETVERKERRTLRDSAIDPVTETRAG